MYVSICIESFENNQLLTEIEISPCGTRERLLINFAKAKIRVMKFSPERINVVGTFA